MLAGPVENGNVFFFVSTPRVSRWNLLVFLYLRSVRFHLLVRVTYYLGGNNLLFGIYVYLFNNDVIYNSTYRFLNWSRFVSFLADVRKASFSIRAARNISTSSSIFFSRNIQVDYKSASKWYILFIDTKSVRLLIISPVKMDRTWSQFRIIWN